MPYALCPVVPHLSEKGYIHFLWPVYTICLTAYIFSISTWIIVVSHSTQLS